MSAFAEIRPFPFIAIMLRDKSWRQQLRECLTLPVCAPLPAVPSSPRPTASPRPWGCSVLSRRRLWLSSGQGARVREQPAGARARKGAGSWQQDLPTLCLRSRAPGAPEATEPPRTVPVLNNVYWGG